MKDDITSYCNNIQCQKETRHSFSHDDWYVCTRCGRAEKGVERSVNGKKKLILLVEGKLSF